MQNSQIKEHDNGDGLTNPIVDMKTIEKVEALEAMSSPKSTSQEQILSNTPDKNASSPKVGSPAAEPAFEN